MLATRQPSSAAMSGRVCRQVTSSPRPMRSSTSGNAASASLTVIVVLYVNPQHCTDAGTNLRPEASPLPVPSQLVESLP